MTNKLDLNAMINKITNDDKDRLLEPGTSIVNVRPGDKVASMIDTFLLLNNGKMPSTYFSDTISKELKELVISDIKHIEVLKELLQEDELYWGSNSALGLLEKEKIIKRNLAHLFVSDLSKKADETL